MTTDRPGLSIRPATTADVPIIAQFLRAMLLELASRGGPPVAQDRGLEERLEAEVHGSLGKKDRFHLLANVDDSAATPIGWAYARTFDREPFYEPEHALHISALYVSPPYRRRGIGRALLEAVLDWGRSTGCASVELNVLVGNPARSLYKELGFGPAQIKMTRKL